MRSVRGIEETSIAHIFNFQACRCMDRTTPKHIVPTKLILPITLLGLQLKIHYPQTIYIIDVTQERIFDAKNIPYFLYNTILKKNHLYLTNLFKLLHNFITFCKIFTIFAVVMRVREFQHA